MRFASIKTAHNQHGMFMPNNAPCRTAKSIKHYFFKGMRHFNPFPPSVPI